MTNMMKLNQLTEVGADTLPKFQRLLVKLGLELAGVIEYDGGETYEIWSRPDGSQQTIIKAIEDQITSSNAIVAEIQKFNKNHAPYRTWLEKLKKSNKI